MSDSLALREEKAGVAPDRNWAILLEIGLIFSPFYLGLMINQWMGQEQISLGGDVVLRQGPFAYLGLGVSLLVFWVFARRQGVGWGDLGLAWPQSWWRMALLALGVSLAVLAAVVTIINPLLAAIPGLVPRDMSGFAFLKGNLPNLILQLVNIWVTAAFLEELLFRGYLLNRLQVLLGQSTIIGLLMAIVGQAVIFGLVHSQQGAAGIFKVGVIGLVFGLSYLATNRNLWPLILAHGLIDTLDMVTHYLGG